MYWIILSLVQVSSGRGANPASHPSIWDLKLGGFGRQLSDNYDLYVYLEDDLLIHGHSFLRDILVQKCR